MRRVIMATTLEMHPMVLWFLTSLSVPNVLLLIPRQEGPGKPIKHRPQVLLIEDDLSHFCKMLIENGMTEGKARQIFNDFRPHVSASMDVVRRRLNEFDARQDRCGIEDIGFTETSGLGKSEIVFTGHGGTRYPVPLDLKQAMVHLTLMVHMGALSIDYAYTLLDAVRNRFADRKDSSFPPLEAETTVQ
jgi:hypothetical protein